MTDETAIPPPDKPKKKRGPPKGVRIGGRGAGTKNKATIRREEAARIEREQLAEIERLRIAGNSPVSAAVQTAGIKRGKDVLADLMRAYMALAVLYQPWPTWVPVVENGVQLRDKEGRPLMRNANPNYDEARFDKYSTMAKDAAAAVAPFHDPRYSAMMVGATVVNKIEVVGGMPDDFAPPQGQVEFKPGTVITPDEIIDVPATLPKAVNE